MNERIAAIVKHPATIPTSIGVVSFGVGVIAGVIFTRRQFDIGAEGINDQDDQLEFTYGKVFNQEPLVDTKESERELIFAPPIEKGSDMVIVNEATDHRPDLGKEFVEGMLQTTEVIERVEEPVLEPVTRNVFPSGDEAWDYETEIEARTESEPFVIHKDEFYGQETDYAQSTLTYYEADDIMVDQEDAPIYNWQMVVGPLKFGHGSGDPNVFHVRNDVRRAEYEILRDSGSFSKSVLGIDEDEPVDAELKHSSDRVKRLRLRDE